MSDIKKAFTSRFPEGHIVEIDWNQLEVVILQIESGDNELKDELNSGVDLHCAMTAAVYHTPYAEVYKAVRDGDAEWIAKRKKIKSARFALQYGASPAKIAKTAGWTEEEARHFVKVYYDKYKGIAFWQREVKRQVSGTKKPVDSAWKGQYISPDGRRYVFTGEFNTEWNTVSFPPTKMQNYPIQGLASDFVKLMRSKVIEQIAKDGFLNDVLPINTIHDSIMFDCRNIIFKTYLDKIITDVYSRAHEYLGLLTQGRRKVEVTLNYSTKSGKNWS